VILLGIGLHEPPHIHGQRTSVRVSTPDIEIIYGNARNNEIVVADGILEALWFLRFRYTMINMPGFECK
jgi:hypothetical protein